jgi:hypothetical protein
MAKEKTAIIILGGGLKRNKNGSWRTANYGKAGDKFGMTGDRLRIIAGAYLAQDHGEYLVLAAGGRGQYKNIPGSPNISRVIKNELLELGVPKKQILEESKSDTTYRQLQNVTRLVRKLRVIKVFILTNQWHIPRILALLKHNPGLRKLAGYEPELLSAETIVLKYDRKKWRKIIQTARSSKEFKKRVKLEMNGIKAIKNQTYFYK